MNIHNCVALMLIGWMLFMAASNLMLPLEDKNQFGTITYNILLFVAVNGLALSLDSTLRIIKRAEEIWGEREVEVK